ncbi:MAG: preprotein translocase subunit SecG [Clostridia bacterium]|nr:preprotein translocase subunit SecG [Clostridia bacterium]
MAVVNVLLSIVLILACLFMIVTVLLQSSNVKGLGAVAGQMETYFGKNKAKTIDAKLALGTKIAATVFVVISLLMLVLDKVA